MQVDIDRKTVNNSVILQKINLTFDEQGLIFLVGKSGAGKTTLLNILAGNDLEFDGQVLLKNTLSSKQSEYRKKISIINQDYNLIGTLNVEENIRLGAQVLHKKIDSNKIIKIVDELELGKLMKRNIDMLSGGEKQRVAIARALVRENDIILCDEPTGNLDSNSSNNIFNILKKMSKTKLVIVVSHDMEAAQKYGDRIIEVSDGKIVSDRSIKSGIMLTADEKTELNENNDNNENNENNEKWKIKYVFKSIIYRKSQFVGISIAIAFALCTLFVIMGLFSGIKKLKTNIDVDILENDKYDITCNKLVQGDEYDGLNLKTKELIEDTNLFCYVDTYYQSSISLFGKFGKEQLTYQVINGDQFYVTRFTNIEGNFPEHIYEVIIDETLADKLFDEGKGLNQTIKAEYCGNEITLTVVGIKKSYNSDEATGNIYIIDALANLLYQIESHSFVCLSKGNSTLFKRKIDVAVQEYNDEVKIVQGTKPEKYGEVVISSNLVNHIMQYVLEEKQLFSTSEVIDGISNKWVFGEFWFLAHTMNRICKVEIVGIVESEIDAVFYGEWYRESPYSTNVCVAYAKNINSDMSTEIDYKMKEIECSYGVKGNAITDIIVGQMVLFISILGIICLLVLFISVLMIRNYFRMTTEARRYEMGVLASLGNTSNDIFSLLFIEQVIYATCLSIAVNLVWGILGHFFFEKTISFNSVSVLKIEWWHFCVNLVVVLVTVVIFSIPQIIKISRMNITNSISTRYQ